jgi:Holliday junction resolvase RusA-like endonuclease
MQRREELDRMDAFMAAKGNHSVAMKVLDVKIPTLPPSANSIYAPVSVGPTLSKRGFNTITMTKEARVWIEHATLFLPPMRLDDTLRYRMELSYHANWYTKQGEIRKKDVRNYEKLVCDTVCRRYLLDDKLVWESLVVKVQDDTKEYVMVKLFTLERMVR